MAIERIPSEHKGGPHVEYFHMGPFHCFVGFTLSPEAYTKELNRLCIKPDEHDNFTLDEDGACTHLFTHKGYLTAIITMGGLSKGRDFAQIAALIAHEACHVVQALWRHSGETRPGDEAEAYLVQYISQRCLYAIQAWRKAKRKRKAKPNDQRASRAPRKAQKQRAKRKARK